MTLASLPPPSGLLFNISPPTAISTLSLHDALPISACVAADRGDVERAVRQPRGEVQPGRGGDHGQRARERSEEHTSELQSHVNLVCRLLLEKKKERREASTKSR